MSLTDTLHVHQPELLPGEADHVEGQHALRGLAAQPLSVQARVPDGQLPVASRTRISELLNCFIRRKLCLRTLSYAGLRPGSR